ncbi:MAG: hypothetical protein ACTSPI_17065, partial [Candidatus Heimdallarchaeaceae archaeon]
MKKIILLMLTLFFTISLSATTDNPRFRIDNNVANKQLLHYINRKWVNTDDILLDSLDIRILTADTIYVWDSLYVQGKTLHDSTVSIGSWGYTGEHIEIPESSSNTNAGLGLYSMVDYSATAGKVFAGSYSRMLAMTTNQVNQSTMVGMESQFRLRDVDIGNGVHAGLWAYAEQSGTSALTGGGTFDAISATVESEAGFSAGATEHVTGLTLDSSINNSATINDTTNFSAIYIKSNGKDWFDGINFKGVTTEIKGQNDETIDNATNGTWNFDAAKLKTTGTIEANGAILTGDTNTFDITSGTGSLNVAAEKTVDFDMDFKVNGTGTTITGVTQANTLTMNEGLIVGDGNTGTITYSAASKVLTVEDNVTVGLDVNALEALASTGILARTTDNTYAQRTITGTANEVDVVNGDGISGNPTIGLPDTVVVTTKLSSATYGSDGTVTDAELLYINSLGSNAQDQLDARCLESVFGTAIGTGLLLDGTTLKTQAGLQSIAGITETNGGILYGTADNTYAWLAAGTANYILQGNGADAPSWTTSPILTNVNVNGIITKSTESVTVSSDAGVASVTTYATYITSENAGGADVVSLADGVAGQEKLIVLRTDGGDDIEITPTNFVNGTKITLDTA